jgi:hypothetical protein
MSIPKKNDHINFVTYSLDDAGDIIGISDTRNINGCVSDITLESLQNNICKDFTILPRNVVIYVKYLDRLDKLDGISGSPCRHTGRIIGIILSGCKEAHLLKVLPIYYVVRVLKEFNECGKFNGLASLYIKYKNSRIDSHARIMRDNSTKYGQIVNAKFKFNQLLVSIDDKIIDHTGYVHCVKLDYKIPLETYIVLNYYVNDKIIIKTTDKRIKSRGLPLIENKCFNYENYVFYEINPVLYKKYLGDSVRLVGPFSKLIQNEDKMYYSQYNRTIIMTEISDKSNDVELMCKMNRKEIRRYDGQTVTRKYVPVLKKINKQNITCINDIKDVIENARGNKLNFTFVMDKNGTNRVLQIPRSLTV